MAPVQPVVPEVHAPVIADAPTTPPSTARVIAAAPPAPPAPRTPPAPNPAEAPRPIAQDPRSAHPAMPILEVQADGKLLFKICDKSQRGPRNCQPARQQAGGYTQEELSRLARAVRGEEAVESTMYRVGKRAATGAGLCALAAGGAAAAGVITAPAAVIAVPGAAAACAAIGGTVGVVEGVVENTGRQRRIDDRVRILTGQSPQRAMNRDELSAFIEDMLSRANSQDPVVLVHPGVSANRTVAAAGPESTGNNDISHEPGAQLRLE